MQIGNSFSSTPGSGFSSIALAQGMNVRKHSKVEAALADAPSTSGTSAAPHAEASPATASPATASPATLLTGGDSSNVMARNFVKQDYAQSKYVTASLQAAQQQQSVVANMNALIGGLSSVAEMWSAEGNSAYVIGLRMGLLVEAKLDQVKDEETNKASEENLEEIKEDVEEKAEEAVSPEESEDGETVTTEDATTGTEAGAESETESETESGEKRVENKDSTTADSANTVQPLPTEESHTESIDKAVEAALQYQVTAALGQPEAARVQAQGQAQELVGQTTAPAQMAFGGIVAQSITQKSVNMLV